jgi:hypothetical protein
MIGRILYKSLSSENAPKLFDWLTQVENAKKIETLENNF